MSFNFSQVEEPKSQQYLQPGHYYLSITGAKYVQPEGQNQQGNPKTPYIEVEFGGKLGTVSENFFVTPKAMDRLQYLHTQYVGKKLDKDLPSAEAVGAYFEKLLTNPKITAMTKGICVGGKQANNGKIYASLPYSNFVLPEGMNFEEGAFDPNSANYKMYVKMNDNPSTTTNAVMIPDSLPSAPNTNDDPFGDLPF